MPLQIVPIGNNRYSVVNIETGAVHAYNTSLENAKKQVNLINRIDSKKNNLLTAVKKQMKKLKIPFESVELSDRPNKKIKVVINGKTIYFGDKNSQTYLEGADKQKRDAYRARASKIYLKDRSRAIDHVYSPAWLSYHVFW